MIQIKSEKNNGKFTKVKVLGHALYDDYGKDIVCSAVSSIVITTVNGILSINKNNLNYMVSKQGINIKINSEDQITQILIKNMLCLLKDLAKKYPQNIEIK